MNNVEDKLVDSWTDKLNPFKDVSAIDSTLDKFTEDGSITEMEQDALRHYFGTRKLANKYGDTMAYVMGVLNAKFDLFFSVDLHNNNIALEHLRKSEGFDFHVGISVLELKHILNDLEVPPYWDEHYKAGMK